MLVIVHPPHHFNDKWNFQISSSGMLSLSSDYLNSFNLSSKSGLPQEIDVLGNLQSEGCRRRTTSTKHVSCQVKVDVFSSVYFFVQCHVLYLIDTVRIPPRCLMLRCEVFHYPAPATSLDLTEENHWLCASHNSH